MTGWWHSPDTETNAVPPKVGVPHPHLLRNAALSREIHPGSSPARAHPRHRLTEVRARIAGAGMGAAGGRARDVTCGRTGDVGAVRQVFVAGINLTRVCDVFNPTGRVLCQMADNSSRLDVMHCRRTLSEGGRP